MTYRSAEQFATSINSLCDRLHTWSYAALPAGTRERLDLALLDLVGVSLAGMRTPELDALVDAATPPPGPHDLLGTRRSVGPVESAWFPAVAAACLELDEGNKHAFGHPAAHVVFAAVAAARLRNQPLTGEQLLTAIAGGYELAARLGRAVQRDASWHTHGHWGVPGAAWAAAYVLGGDARQCAAAVGAAGSLMHVAPWPVVLEGDFTRNLWMADAVPAGLRAAQLALAGLAPGPEAALHGLALVGEVDADSLDRDPDRLLCGEGYLKLHSACSYTHPAIDLVLQLREVLPAATSVHVRACSLVAPLLGRDAHNRLSAMFSMPFVVATAWAHGEVSPRVMDPMSDAFARSRDLVERVEVSVDDTLDRWLPARRVTEVTFTDGQDHAGAAAPNPIGDHDHFPLGPADVRAKLTRLLGTETAEQVTAVVTGLAGTSDVVTALARLP